MNPILCTIKSLQTRTTLWKFRGIMRCLTTQNSSDKPGGRNNVKENLAEVRNKMKKMQSDDEGMRDKTEAMRRAWNKARHGTPLPLESKLASLKGQPATPNKLKEETSPHVPPRVNSPVPITKPQPVNLSIPYIKPGDVFNQIVQALEGLTSRQENALCVVPTIYGGIGIGKTRTAFEAVNIWGKNSKGGKLKYACIKLNPSMNNVKMKDPRTDAGFFILVAFGQNVKHPNHKHWNEAIDNLKKLDADAIVLHIDEYQLDKDFVASVVRGCMYLRQDSSVKCLMVPILTGVSGNIRFDLDSESNSWRSLPILLSPFENTLALEKAFVNTIGLPWDVYVSRPEYHLLFLATGGMPGQVNMLVNVVGTVREQSKWCAGSEGWFNTMKDKVAGMDKLNEWCKSLGLNPELKSSRHLILQIGMMAMLGATVNESDLVSKSDPGLTLTWGTVLNSGLVPFYKQEHTFRLTVSLYAALSIMEMVEDDVVPGILEYRNPDDYHGTLGTLQSLEVVSQAALYLRLRAAQLGGRTHIAIEHLRPGARLFYAEQVDKIELVVPQQDQLNWITEGGGQANLMIHDCKVGDIGIIGKNHVGLDGFERFRGLVWKKGNNAPEHVIVEFMSHVRSSKIGSSIALQFNDIVGMKEKFDILLGCQPILDPSRMSEQDIENVKNNNKASRLQWPDTKEYRDNDGKSVTMRVIRVVDVVSDRIVKELFAPKNVKPIRNLVDSLPCGAAMMITSRNELKNVLGDTLGGVRNLMRDVDRLSR